MNDVFTLGEHPQYAQLLGVGVVWISLHCSGMCGPIVVGLDIGGGLRERLNSNTPRRKRLFGSALLVTCYQLGRSLTYAVLGALAGLGGAALQSVLAQIVKITGLLVAAFLITYGALRLSGLARLAEGAGNPWWGRMLGGLANRLQNTPGYRQKFFLGMAMGLMPCMITLWTLSLAASTQSPMHGALLMVLQVWMTSAVIYPFGMAPTFAPARPAPWRERILSCLIVFSGCWLALIAAAANNWIGHASVGFRLAERGFAIMFW
jgi:sulfite exporter TauE/SafE